MGKTSEKSHSNRIKLLFQAKYNTPKMRSRVKPTFVHPLAYIWPPLSKRAIFKEVLKMLFS